MCRRDSSDMLVRMFLDRYQLNLLSLPGRRVRCGSVYVRQGGRLTAPGMLADIMEPELSLPKPFHEDDLPDLSGKWSDSVAAGVGLGLMESFLAALGAAGLLDELKASVQRARTRTVAFRFRRVSRDSIDPMSLGRALGGHELLRSNPWVRDGNRYFAVASVVWSPSISIRGRDESDAAVDLGAGLASVADANGNVKVERSGDNELVYQAREPLAIAVELYELRWDGATRQLSFHTPKGPIPLHGLAEDEPPEPVQLGDDDDVMIAPEELELASPRS